MLITDVLLGLLSIYFSRKIARLPTNELFFKHWHLFLLFFGIGTILGGIGHAFYNYLELGGKIPTWLFAILSVYFIESAMLSIHPNQSLARRFSMYSFIKLLLMVVALVMILIFATPSSKINLSIILVIINSLLGVTLSAGFLGWYYYRIGLSSYFGYFFSGVLIMIPSSAVFLFDINPLLWFDKNDLSHLILAIGITFFYAGIISLYNQNESIPYQKSVNATYDKGTTSR